MIYKIGDVVSFAYRDGFAKLTSLGNMFKYGIFGYTHSAIVYEVSDDFIYLAEALDEGITIGKYEKWWLDARINDGKVAISRAKSIDAKKVVQFCNKHRGEPYSYMNILDILIFWVTGRSNVLDTKDDWICSEFVGECLLFSAGIDIVKEFKLPKNDYVTPMELFLSTQLNLIGGVKNGNQNSERNS
jgi:hypothetical protein